MVGRILGKTAPLLVGLSVFVAGCDGSKEDSRGFFETGPTTDELVQQIEAGLTPLDTAFLAPALVGIDPETHGQLIAHVKESKEKCGQERNGPAALIRVADSLEEKLEPAREAENPYLVLLLCDLIEILKPESRPIERYREWATVRKNRPVVVICGWAELTNQPVEMVDVFCKVYLPETGEVKTIRIRPGEETLGLKFKEILGRKSGLLIEYLATGEEFEVYGP